MNYIFHLLIMIEIYTILALSLNLVVGYTGLLSLSYAAFYGLGAINVWDWKKGIVYTTLYVNWITGGVTLQKGTLREGENWTPGKASIFWNTVFANVQSNKPTFLFIKEGE